MVRETVSGRSAIRMRGDVSLDNNGGFVQIALDLAPAGGAVDASAWRGIELDVFGNGEEYGVHLRTPDLTRPWQSYRQSFTAASKWQTIQLPFDCFAPYRTEVSLDIRRLRRIGVVAMERPLKQICHSAACGSSIERAIACSIISRSLASSEAREGFASNSAASSIALRMP